MAVKLVDHLQTVGHLKCIAGLCIKYFEAKAGGFEQTPSNPLPTSLCYISGKFHRSTHLCGVHSRSVQLHKSQHKLALYICSRKETFRTVCGLGMRLHTHKCGHSYLPPPPAPFPTFLQSSIQKTPHPLQATDPGGTITVVTASGRSFTQQINTEDTAVQETNPATPGQLVF